MKINRCLSYTKKVNKRRFCIGLCVSVLAVTLSGSLYAQSREEIYSKGFLSIEWWKEITVLR